MGLGRTWLCAAVALVQTACGGPLSEPEAGPDQGAIAARADALCDGNTYRQLVLHVSSYPVSATACDNAPRGSFACPYSDLMDAQAVADAFVFAERAACPGAGMIKVKILVRGTFYGDWFRWRHPYSNVVLMLMNEPTESATFYGYGGTQGGGTNCQSDYCKNDAHRPCPTCIPTYDPSPCDFNTSARDGGPEDPTSVESSCRVGYTFFEAQSTSTAFNNSDADGFGDILIQGLTIKYYSRAMTVHVDDDIPFAGSLQIKSNVFYRIGEIANDEETPHGMDDQTSAIDLRGVDRPVVRDNQFVQISNVGDFDSAVLIHAVYAVDSDAGFYYRNRFENISGQAIKFRNGSDRNLVVSNQMVGGTHSVTQFPFQDYFKGWENSENERASFENVFRGNSFERGHVADPCAQMADSVALRTIVCPPQPGAGYYADVSEAGTPYRMIIGDRAYFCEARSSTPNSLRNLRWHIIPNYGDPPSLPPSQVPAATGQSYSCANPNTRN